MTTNTELIARLRETASKGVSAWGDLQMEAAKELEIVTAEREAYASAMDRMKAESSDFATIAGLEASVSRLSSIVDEQLRLLIDVEKECGTDGYGGEFEDGESVIIDRVRAHIACYAAPILQKPAKPLGSKGCPTCKHSDSWGLPDCPANGALCHPSLSGIGSNWEPLNAAAPQPKETK